ncbi:hypothetical protein [Mycobacterium hubeiense]|uniref:hypothetical protein n=1 Tax=Mycobacterium hubeiense TaxID=1867256 RepID=UPI00115B69C8|nr:hypothetical protein [Mycobacterium sp. QGD 101]
MALVVAIAGFAAACSRQTPELPSNNDPATVHELLVGSDGVQFLAEISKYDWPDNGAKAAGYFMWIKRDATSGDGRTAVRAGETAHVIASFLADNRNDLEGISHGFLGLQHSSVGEINPDLVSAYASALTPYQVSMADDDAVDGFKPLGDLAASRDVFVVIATGRDAGTQFIDSAYERAAGVAADAARQACTGQEQSTSSGAKAIQTAATLSGLAAAAASSANIPTKNSHQAMDDILYAMASACVPVAETPIEGQILDYVEGRRLLTPDEIVQQRNAGLEDYYQSQRDYLYTRGLDISGFVDWYASAKGS